MRLDDEQIERYSRQLILQEVGPRGQERLLAARVAVVGTGVAAERIVAHLAAAGVGWIAGAPELGAAIDPQQPDVTLAPLADAAAAPCDAAVVVAATLDAAADAVTAWSPHAATVLWLAGGGAGAAPLCPRCAAPATAPVTAELAALREVVLATIVATEVVKAVLAIGAPLTGRVVTYDPATATLAQLPIDGRCCH